jgi:wobble nucleotide-excising tRNase
LKVGDHEIRTNDKANYSLKYSLSEGDKNSLALSFFFAKLELIENLNEITLIVDDPISSLDYSRKNTTLNNLVSFSKKVKCFILLSHDLSFANDFSRRLNYQCQNLKIVASSSTSSIQSHDIETETLTGIFKDLTVLNNFLDLGANSDSERRDVVRCIRPAIEGIFRIKFFKKILKTEWLGDMISKIRESQEGSVFYRLKSILNELIEINDYSKEYHHSNPYNHEVPINDGELHNYIVRTLKVIETI